MDNTPMQTALKSLVIGLGLLIVLGLGLLVYGFAKKSSNPDWRLFGTAKTPPVTVVPQPPLRLTGDIKLNLPTGCDIRGVNAAGGFLYVLTGPRSACGEVLIIDPSTGLIVGRLTP